jgi:hypothetical protein
MSNQNIKEKIDFYLEKQLPVHIKNIDGTWDNGVIVEYESPNVLIFKEVKRGLIHIFLADIADIEDLRRIGE